MDKTKNSKEILAEFEKMMLDKEEIFKQIEIEKQRLLTELKFLMSEGEPSQIDDMIEYVNRTFLNIYGLSVIRISDIDKINEKLF